MAITLGRDGACSAHLIASYLAMPLLFVEVWMFINCIVLVQRTMTRSIASVLMIADIAVTTCLLGMVFLKCSGAYPQSFTSPFVVLEVFSKSIAGFCEQIYLITRFYKMSNNLPLTLLLALFAFAQVGSHFFAGVYMAQRLHLPVHLALNNPTMMTGWSLGAAVDILVTLGIAWQLKRLQVVFTSTKSMVHKFILMTVVSGGLTALYAIVILVLYTRKNRFAFIVVAINFAKIYSITVFTNLMFIHGMQHTSTVIIGESEPFGHSVKIPVSSAECPTTTNSNSCQSPQVQTATSGSFNLHKTPSELTAYGGNS